MKTLSPLHEVVAATDNSGIDLHVLGIPESRQNSAPSKSAFGSMFNPACRSLWESMFGRDEVMSVLRAEPNIAEKWRIAIVEFMSMCRIASMNPFPSAAANRNTRIAKSLQSSRKLLGKALDDCHVLASYNLKNVRKSVERTYQGFIVTITIDLVSKRDGEYSSQDALISRITRPECRFKHMGSGIYSRTVNANVTINFDTSKTLTKLIYTLVSTEQPFVVVRGNKAAVTKTQYENFVIDTLVNPALRSHKLETVTNKRTVV